VTKPSAILFDFGGTLDGASHWLDRFTAHYRACGIEISRDELDPAFDFATKAGYAAGKPMERFKLGDLVRFLVGNQFEYLRREGPDRIKESILKMAPRDRFNAVERIRDSFLKETVAALSTSRAILERLRGDYRLGVISNWYGNLDAIIAEAGMTRLFDAVVDSTRVHSFKPHNEIFLAALKAMKVRAEEAAMVGDSMPKDCAPAHRLGMRTVFLRSTGSAASTAQLEDGAGEAYRPDYMIESLEDLLKIRW